MRIAVMGAGAVGGYLGARAAQAGHSVTLIARGEHLKAIRERGLQILSPEGEWSPPTLRATDNPAEAGVADLVLFCVKTYDTDSAAAAMKPMVGPDTVVLPLQNGVESEDRLTRVLGPGRVLGGSVRVVAVIDEPGVLRVNTPAALVFGELDGSISPRVERIRAALSAAQGLKVNLTSDIVGALWTKMIFICGVAGVASVCRSAMGPIAALPETCQMLEDAMQECAAVARARGVRLPEDAVAKQFGYAVGMPPDSKPSMLHDLERGHRLEVDALNGTVVRYGRELRVPTPVNGAIYAVLKLWGAVRA